MYDTLGGKAEVSLNGITIPAELLSEISTDIAEGTRERKTLAGTFTRPSGNLDTAQATFTMYLPSMDYLKDIFPDVYNAPTAPQTTGNIVLGSSTCSARTSGPVNIHFTCDDTDANDVNFPDAQIAYNFALTYNDSDDLSVEVMVYGQPSASGVVRLGTGNLTEVSIWDAATGSTVPVAS